MSGEVECATQFPKTALLVIQPTPFCNIDCAYCYLPHRSSKQRMSLEVAENIFERLFRFPTIRESVDLVWHAGEPLVLPISYYEEMFTLIQRLAGPHLKINHAFQTNATLITDDWCELIKKWDVNLGMSIDGPEEFHDLNRKYRNGSGSFAAAHRGLQIVKKNDLPFHLISVLTTASMRAPDKMFEFYERENVPYVCFNIEEKEGTHKTSDVIDGPRFDPSYRAFLARFFELIAQRGSPMMVREFEAALDFIQGYAKGIRSVENEPFMIISVDCEGSMSTFSPELLAVDHPNYGKFTFGNVIKDDFETISKNIDESKTYIDIRAGVKKCKQECQYFNMCGGGAPANKIFENHTADSTETGYCRAHQVGINLLLDLIERVPEMKTQGLERSKAGAEKNFAPI